MAAEVYHATMAMSAGGLKRMAKSPATFYGLQLDPNRPPAGEPSPAMKNGTLVHCALFEPAELAARYVVKPEGFDGRTKEGKAWAAAQTGEVVDAAQMAAAKAQTAAVRALPDLAALLSEGEPEASAFWTDEATGELCKCRPDWTSPAGDGVILVDGKTCQDASPEGFAKAIWNWDYHLQAAWYSDGYELATGKRVHGFVFAAVESAWPHQAAAYMLDDEVLARARAKNRELLDLYAECRRTGIWPGYPNTIQPIGLPAWAK
jgi:exodeoxyribonuclease VIII